MGGASAEEIQTERWTSLTSFIRQWYYEPDIQALEVAISIAQAHYYLSDKPLWALVLGNSGSGKTELMIHVLEGFAPLTPDGRIPIVDTPPGHTPVTNVFILDDLSANTLLSGYQKHGKINSKNSLLHLLGKSILFLMPDFTLFLSKRKDEQMEIMGQLRRVWDGHLTRPLGNSDGKILEWGPGNKATIIGAATPAIETRWDMSNDLGSRFMIVRWRTGPDKVALIQAAMQQTGHQGFISAEIRKLARVFIAGARLAEPVSPEQAQNLRYIATMVVQTRRSVDRNPRGDITGASEAEEPTRVSQAMGQVVRAHAGLFGRSTPNEQDVKMGRRLGLDTIPDYRRRIIEAVGNNQAVSLGDLARELKQSLQTLRYQIWELEALRILDLHSGKDNGTSDYVMLTEEFRQLWRDAGLG